LKPEQEQSREIAKLIRQLADLVPVAVCSGNHDNAGRLVSYDLASVYEWFIDLGTHRNVITDGSTRKLENLIVTTVPYHCSRQEKLIWLDRGSTIHRQTRMPWIVLYHVPAKYGLGVSGEESEAAELLAAYRPDYFISGHDHAFPYTTGQSWNQKWASRTCWFRVNCFQRGSLTTLSWTLNQENCLGIRPARRGYPRMGFMIIGVEVRQCATTR
jgi:hypothetical protein